MLIPRSPRPRRLAFAVATSRWLTQAPLWLGVAIAAGVWGCQPPDTFLRSGSGGQVGSGQGGVGLGGHTGTGGATGLGGTNGIGGATGTGGGAGAAGRTGTGGGTGVAGTTGAGGRGTGGVVGAGGTPDGGAPDRAGAGGMIGTGGAAGADAGSDADSGSVGGTGPCAGLCANPIIITMVQLPSTNQGTDATCYESTLTHQGGNCGNFMAPRTFSINGTVIPICTSGGNFSLPARVNGGYCFQSSAGQPQFAYFGLF